MQDDRVSRSRWLSLLLLFLGGAACDGCEDASTAPQDGGGDNGGAGGGIDGGGAAGGDGGSGGTSMIGDAPRWPITANIRITSATPTSFSVEWDAATDDVAVSGYRVLVDGVEATSVDAETFAFVVADVVVGEYHLVEIEAQDGDGNATLGPFIHGMAVPGAPVAPPADPGVPFSMNDAMAFLVAEPDPVQLGIASGALEPRRIAILRGRVLQAEQPLPGAEVTIKGQPELGRAISRADGHFEMIVNGGGQLFVELRHPDFLAAQRTIAPGWEDWVHLRDVVLVQRDPNATEIDLATGGVARGSVISDEDGVRQARLFIPPGTGAQIRMPDGTTEPIDTLTLRITEFTVGDQGPERMPMSLPCFSAYTYAVAITADEADAVGGEVELDEPVALRVDNFLGIPVGSAVPVGAFEEGDSAWSSGGSGKTVQVVFKDADGKAHVDTDGDGVADDEGFEDEELEDVGDEFEEGDEFSNVDVDSLVKLDLNHPRRNNATPPLGIDDPTSPDPLANPDAQSDGGADECGGASNPGGGEQESSNCEPGSKISVEAQSLGQQLTVTGTPFSLHYESARVLGRAGLFQLDIPISEDPPPESVLGVSVEVSIAGTVQSFILPSPGPDESIPFVWDGNDAWGRRAFGRLPVDVAIDYLYAARYSVGPGMDFAFPATAAGLALVEGRSIVPIINSKRWRGSLGSPGGLALGLEGWSLDAVHVLDRIGGRIYLGDGTERSVGTTGWVIDRVAGTGNGDFSDVPGPALDASFFLVSDVEALPDGGFLVALAYPGRVLRVSAEGQISVAAGNGGFGNTGDGGPAIDATIGEPRAVSAAPDGSFYVATGSGCVIRKVDPEGIISTVAGTGICLSPDDPVVEDDAAAATPFSTTEDVAVACDGSVWVAEAEANRIRRIDPSGVVRTIIGGAGRGFGGDGGGADEALIDNPYSILVTGRCEVYFNDANNYRIRMIDDGGVVRTVAGNGDNARDTPIVGEGGPATGANLGDYLRLALLPDGNLLVNDPFTARILAVSKDGTLRRFAGNGGMGDDFDGRSALSARLSATGGISVMPDGSVLSGAHARVLRIHKVPQNRLPDADIPIPSFDGNEIWVFDEAGRHLRTLDALTNTTLLEMGYVDGRLTSLADSAGNITTITRDASGAPTAIVSPTGQTTTLVSDANLNLTEVTNPLGQSYSFGYAAGGLMTSLVDPEGNGHTFAHDALGLLTFDGGPGGENRSLTRINHPDGRVQVDVETSLGRTSSYFVEPGIDGWTRRLIDAAGAETIFTVYRDGSQSLVRPDGTAVLQQFGPDPRWGMLAPVQSLRQVTSPSGVVASRSIDRTLELADEGDVLSLVSLSDNVTTTGATTVRSTDAVARTLTVLPPAGTASLIQFDGAGRVVQVQLDPVLVPETFMYDALGRLTARAWRGRSYDWTYDGNDRIATFTNGVGDTWAYGWNAANRPVTMLDPAGGLVGYGFDDNGWLIEMTIPVSGTASMGRDALGRLLSFTPASGAGSATRVYDMDGALDAVTLPSGRVIDVTFDAGGRFESASYPEAIASVTYAGVTSRPASMSWAPVVGEAQSTAFEYDGSLITRSVWSGPTPAIIDYAYGQEARLASRTISSGTDSHVTSFTYREDGALLGMAGFSFERNGPGSAPSAQNDGALDVQLSFHGSALLNTRATSVAGTPLYSIAVSHDAAARVIQNVESVQGVATTWTYTRDDAGRLTTVRADGLVVESYAWDLGGNPLSRQIGAGPVEIVTLDGQGRLATVGSTTYGFDADGAMTSRGGDTFSYSARGELLGAQVGGDTVTYGYDAWGRRTSRDGPGGSTRYYYGDLDHPARVTHVRGEGGALDTLHYDEAGILMAIDRGATRLYVACDYVGSPRVISDASGSVLRVIERDAFGGIIADSDPTFELPIGFAGGIADELTGLVRFGWRDYDPASGRFTARDPWRFRGRSRNLYAYVHSDPVGFIDPDGLFEIGGSFYNIVGGGGSVAIDDNGMSVCVEFGFGLGASLDIDPNAASISGETHGTVAELKAQAGALGATAKLSMRDGCAPQFGAEAALGPVRVDTDDGFKISAHPEDWGDQVISGGKVGVQGKIARKHCYELF